eukprot:scaffold1595_cov171-Amphora_coffeaeformis.AAC.3
MGKVNPNPLADPSKTPLDIVVRNIRRRLWAALAQEDAPTALRLYKATRREWEDWVCREQEQQHQADEEARASRKRLPSFRKKSKSRIHGDATTMVTVDPTLQASLENNQAPLLLQHFLPSEPFIEDDFHDPNDPYPPMNPDRKRVIRNQSSAVGRGRFAIGALLGRTVEQQPERQTNHAKNDDDGLPLTTPLHEAARIGSGELVRLLLEQAALTSDPNARNGKGQSVLHCVAGGLTRIEEQNGATASTMSIRVPHVDLHPTEEPIAAKRAVRAVGRLFRAAWTKEAGHIPKKSAITLADWRALELDRMDAALAILSWSSEEGDREGISTNAVDDDGRTALHYAAEAGRSEFCQALLSRMETFLTLIDQQRKTPCDLAGGAGHTELAAHLEARALLYRDPFGMDDELLAQIIQMKGDDDEEEAKLVSPFSWFTTFDMKQINKERERRVQEALVLVKKVVARRSDGEKAVELLLGEPVKKEEPDIETHNFINIHPGHIEMLLNKHGWDVKKAAAAFYRSPQKAFEKCGIDLPSSEENVKEEESKENLKGEECEQTCLICCESFPIASDEWKSLQTCSHGFCRPCLGDYIADVAKSRSYGLAVKCPHHECKAPLTPIEVEHLSSDKQDYERVVATSNSNFVVSNDTLRYCPHPNCPCVVKFGLPKFAKDAGLDVVEIFHRVGGTCTTRGTKNDHQFVLSYQGVCDPQYFNHEKNPEKAHRFCFSCGEAFAHWPLQCEKLDSWKSEVANHVKEVEGGNVEDEDFNAIAQKLWMKANTRPCPKCQVPIEKDQGCNHVSCRQKCFFVHIEAHTLSLTLPSFLLHLPSNP